jgi:hypothetical protein
MAINRVEYPITFEEAIAVLRELAAEIGKDAAREQRIGDPRPEVLMWAANRLARLEFAAIGPSKVTRIRRKE